MIEDCIAMSEDGDWYAFPAAASRAQVITALAQGSSWLDVLREFHVKQGYVWENPDGWWFECAETDVGATRAWIAKARP